MWAGGFLIETARDSALPLEVRRRAVVIARHFPTVEDISAMSLLRYPIGPAVVLVPPDESDDEHQYGLFGPLRRTTRFAWPGAT